jgi:hypothetical protein
MTFAFGCTRAGFQARCRTSCRMYRVRPSEARSAEWRPEAEFGAPWQMHTVGCRSRIDGSTSPNQLLRLSRSRYAGSPRRHAPSHRVGHGRAYVVKPDRTTRRLKAFLQSCPPSFSDFCFWSVLQHSAQSEGACGDVAGENPDCWRSSRPIPRGHDGEERGSGCPHAKATDTSSYPHRRIRIRVEHRMLQPG